MIILNVEELVLLMKICKYCGKKFEPIDKNHSWQIYCSSECQKKSIVYTKKQRERKKEYQRKYNKQYKKQYNKWRKKYRNTIKGKELLKKYSNKHYQRNKNKYSAQRLAQKIPLESNCLFCNTTKNLIKHHPNHNEPLRINTLCRQCHSDLHNHMVMGL